MERTFFTKALAIVAAVCCALSADAFQFQKDGIYYKFIDNNKVEVTYKDDKHKCYSGKVVIPEKVPYEGNYYDVTAIGSEAFMNCPELTAVTIPNSITHIYDGAFHGCKGLKEIRIPA